MYKLTAVHMFILLNELIDAPMFHPLRDHYKPAFTYCHSKQWQHIWMSEVLPSNSLSAEALQLIHQYRCGCVGLRPTLRTTSRSSLRHTRTTLMATWRPLYIPRDTLAKPPRPTSVEPFEQSGMCIDFGITRCRLHVLQSLLSNLSRALSEVE
jgi:hypothetical protein